MDVPAIHRRLDRFRRCGHDVVMPNFRHRRHIATAHAGRADDPDVVAVMIRQIGQQRLAPIISQVRLSHTRMVNSGSAASPSFSTSKCA